MTDYMPGLRVLVTGSRTWADAGVVAGALYRAAERVSDGGRLTVVHGACPKGADWMATQWCRHYAGLLAGRGVTVVEEPWPADWTGLGPRAGTVRNTAMVAAGADLCTAFVDSCASTKCRRMGSHGSHGGTDCADKAQAAGIELWPFGPYVDRWAQTALDLA